MNHGEETNILDINLSVMLLWFGGGGRLLQAAICCEHMDHFVVIGEPDVPRTAKAAPSECWSCTSTHLAAPCVCIAVTRTHKHAHTDAYGLFVLFLQIYTDWANHYLAKSGCQRLIKDLSQDVTDGVLLAQIIQIIGTHTHTRRTQASAPASIYSPLSAADPTILPCSTSLSASRSLFVLTLFTSHLGSLQL